MLGGSSIILRGTVPEVLRDLRATNSGYDSDFAEDEGTELAERGTGPLVRPLLYLEQPSIPADER